MSVSETFELDEDDRQVVASIDSDGRDVLVLRVNDRDIVLPAEVSHAVERLLAGLASGSPVLVATSDAELTTQQAADLLGISRTYIVRLIDQGSLPAHRVGTHRRLLASDVLTHRRRRDQRLADVASIGEADDELGITTY